MSFEYDDEFLTQINENADLIEYASRSLDMEERGGCLWAHCPAHVDLTPSLKFDPSRNTYKCFSCGKGGGMIGYLIDYEGLSFENAVQKAASIANLDPAKRCRSHTIAFLRKLKDTMQTKKQPEAHRILDASELMKYKKEPAEEWIDEGIDKDVMDTFGIRIDERANRIVYPVYDVDGNLINIKGRTRYPNYKKLGISKYQNYYQIGTMDYFQCLNYTMPYVSEKHEVIIFESIKSVMKAYGWGYKNCVSAETHTLNPYQIDLLIKMKCDVVLAYDSDVSYAEKGVKKNVDTLKRLTNVYIIEEFAGLLGGAGAKNAPVDCGREIWEELYANKRKVV